MDRDAGTDGSDHGSASGVAALLPTPTRSRHTGTSEQRKAEGQQVDLVHVVNDLALLPTPLTTDGQIPGTVQDRIDGGWRIQLVNVINSLASGDQLLPTPSAGFMNSSAGHGEARPSGHVATTNIAGIVELRPEIWGQFAPAIARWEGVLGRPAPDPRSADEKLNPAFVEWMMGLPEGWVTGLGFARSTALKALGNGVVPQQAEAAFRFMIANPNTQELAA